MNTTCVIMIDVNVCVQEYNMRSQFASSLRDSVFGFRTYEGNSWLQQYDVPHTPVDPDTAAVNRIKQNGAQLNVSATWRQGEEQSLHGCQPLSIV